MTEPLYGRPYDKPIMYPDNRDRVPLSSFLTVPPPPDGWSEIEAAIATLHREDSRRRDAIAATGIVAAIVHAVAGDEPVTVDLDVVDAQTGRTRWDLSVVQLTDGRLQLRAVPTTREDAE